MSTTDAETHLSFPVLLPEDEFGDRISTPDNLSNIPDVILMGESMYGEYFSNFSDYGLGGEKSSSIISTARSLFGEQYDGFWEQYESFPAYIGEAMEGPQEVQEEEEEIEEEEEEEEEKEEIFYASEKKKKVKGVSELEPRRRSLFVHSSPTHFPDINRARKSVFGSIFVRTTGYLKEEAALLKSVAESNYNMLQSMLSSFEKILSSSSMSSDKKKIAMAYRDSVMKNLETHGMSRTYSDGSIHWEIYPVTQNYLFSIQLGDHVHQTRNLSRIEDRIVNGTTQFLKPLFLWPTGSSWTGHWDLLGMAGQGKYFMPHGVSYIGNMQNGMFHDDDATLIYPNNFKALHCVYEKGELLDCQFQFPDNLMHEKPNWGYCKFPDRRFWSEVVHGLKPAKMAQKTQLDPPRKIPPQCYDTSDGFYNPKTLMLVSPGGELLRIPVCSEDLWIKKYCRKANPDFANFRPDLFENWFNYDENLIKSIIDQHESYRVGKISYEELQQFYADNDLLLSSSKYKKRKTPSEIALEEFINSIPSPLELKTPKVVKKYQGHELLVHRNVGVSEEISKKFGSPVDNKTSKSFQTLNRESELRGKLSSSQAGLIPKSSKISFKLKDDEESTTDAESQLTDSSVVESARNVPKEFMKNQPILRLKQPFPEKEKPPQEKRPCAGRKSGNESVSLNLEREGEIISAVSFERKELRKFMKKMIMHLVTNFLLKEREKHRERYKWATKVPSPKEIPKKTVNENCMAVLHELFMSIPDREEYCDSDPDKTVYFKKLSEDKFNILKYWGNRMYTLEFSEGVAADRTES